MSMCPPQSATNLSTLVDVLRWRAEHQPNQLAFSFLPSGDADAVNCTYSQLDQHARTIAAYLQQVAEPDARILLLYPPGLDYVSAFFGCLYAGMVAVPAYPPRRHRSNTRIQAIIADAGAKIALTHESLGAQSEERATWLGTIGQIDCLTVPSAATDLVQQWVDPGVTEETLAFLQYTSGSTSTPKGVMLTHSNLMHNLARIQRCFEHTSESRGVIWLPPYHDMGLIGGILQPLYVGFPVTLMPPAAFLQSPLRWLDVISRTRATTSGGPNFAFDLCVRNITPQQRETLDLSSWQVAFTGAEPIRAETIQRFTAAFAPCGFRPEAFYPCYGLAEATLIVSGGIKAAPPIIQAFQSSALRQQIVEAATGDDASLLVSSGVPQAEDQLRIVDPQTGRECQMQQIGEIWVAGPSVARGYWGQDEETSRTFGAHLADSGAGPFLRTGDLGFMHQGELFIAGRLKDVIIIGGRNYYPQDIELTAERSHPALRPNSGAAFAVDIEGVERLVIAYELERQQRNVDSATVATAVRQAVVTEHEVQVSTVVLLKPGGIPKTSSGKIQRQACRAAFLAGTLPAIAQSQINQSDRAEPIETLNREKLLATDAAARPPLLTSYLHAQISQLLGISAATFQADQPLSAQGLDSLTATELRHQLEVAFDVDLPFPMLLEGATLRQVADEVLSQLTAAVTPTTPLLLARPDPPTEYPLSYGQRAMWFLHQLAPTSAAYNISRAVRIHHALDTAAFYRALRQLVARHEALRTVFAASGGDLIQRVRSQIEVAFTVEDVAGWNQDALLERLTEEAHRPFDLEQGPLLRALIFSQSQNEHVLLFVAHHIVVDFWSLALLLRELSVLYGGELDDQPVTLPPLALHYSDYVQWQTNMLASAAGEQHWQAWQQQLSDDLPVLDLPTDRPRPPVQTYHGAVQHFTISPEVAQRVQAISAEHGTTLYTTLLTAFQVLLLRLTGQHDIVVGSPTAGRDHVQMAGLVGYYINPLVLRSRLDDEQSFAEALAHVRQVVLHAFAHQTYPFGLLAERLQSNRAADRPPLFQVMFVLQQDPIRGVAGLAALAIEQEGSELALGPLRFEPIALEQRTAQFDLTLMIADLDGQLVGSFQYNSDLFEASTIARMAGYFQTLLAGLVAEPQRSLGSAPLLSADQQRQILQDWNATAAVLPKGDTIHDLIQAQVLRDPGAEAIIFEDSTLSYSELNRRSNQLAQHLRALGVGPGVIVGLCLHRSPDLIIGLLGILKAGGAYLPLDPIYPVERLQFMLHDAQSPILVSHERLAQMIGYDTATSPYRCVYLDRDEAHIQQQPISMPHSGAESADLAYVIYTSGSTGQPKGVLIQHSSVLNFFVGMDQRVGCGPQDTLLAVTSISFDISVLELLWPLTRGARVVLLDEQAMQRGTASRAAHSTQPIDFSLFYFASAASAAPHEKYRLLFEGARFADEHDFAAVWTPERHFHDFGGLYPNPAVTSAALAVQTQRIAIRAGSVVLPLHHPVRVAEEWSVVDNITNGRVGIAFASGWHADDFIFFPEHYADRKTVLINAIETVQRLWRGEAISATGGGGNEIAVRLYPAPIQPELPIWLTAAGGAETFIKAGELGVGVLTHLLGQSIDELAGKIQSYRAALAQHGHRPEAAHVTLMLHTFIGEDRDQVREQVRVPFTNYLRSSVSLISNLITSLGLPLDLKTMSQQDMDDLLTFAFDRYFETSALFGTPESCLDLIDRLKAIGVDEVACLIDFGVEADMALAGLHPLNELRKLANQTQPVHDYSLAAQALRYQPSLMQCTPSLMEMLSGDGATLQALHPLRCLLLGGEALPPELAAQLRGTLSAQIINMYGPTETTIWSATHELAEVETSIPIGRPIANTQIYLLDQMLQPVPIGIPGDLYIGGGGLARGYHGRPPLTAERFVPDPFSHLEGARPGGRLYRTGDLGRWRADGTIEFLGRSDYQIKLRGYRIELGEIEAALAQHPDVRQAVVLLREDQPGDQRLVAYVVGEEPRTKNQEPRDGTDGSRFSVLGSDLRMFLAERVPDYMIPSSFVLLPTLPLTANGKIDRKALPAPESQRAVSSEYIAPQSKTEQIIADIWQDVLKLEQVSVKDNFFDLGGHSLLLAQVHRQLQNTFGPNLPLIKLIEYPTIGALARYLSQESTDSGALQASQDRAQRQLVGLRRQRQRMRTEDSTS